MERLSWLAASALATGLVAVPAWAQGVDEEIVVTAQKREESLSRVPVAITAFGADTLDNLGVQRAVDIVAQVPNLNFQGPFGDSGAPVFNLRGVSTLDFGDANEPSVSVYSDDIYIGSTAGHGMQMFDLERVEVLRGPQNTLYGRNATGGLVHFISKRPTDEFEAHIEGQYGSYGRHVFEGYVSGPLTNGLRARVSARRDVDDGWQRNLAAGGRFASNDTFAGKLLVDADLASNVSLLAKLHYGRNDGTYPLYAFFGTQDPATGTPCSNDRILRSECANASGFRDPDPDPRRAYSLASHLPNEARAWGASARIEWALGTVTLTSVTAFERIKRRITEDANSAGAEAVPLLIDYTADNEQFSQELRLSGEAGALSWLVGAYYYGDKRFVTNAIPSFDFTVFADLETETWALFGQGSYGLSDSLTFTAGLRYTDERRELINLSSVSGGRAGSRDGIPFFSTSNRISVGKFTGRAALEWTPGDSLLVYASISNGFKSGGFNTVLVGSQDEVGPVGKEEIIAYEVGLKMRAGSAMSFNAAAFYYDYQDIQVIGTISGPNSPPAARYINAGNARIYGAEVEMAFRPVEGLSANLALGLLNTELLTDPGTVFDGKPLNGNRVQVAPSTTVSGVVRYEMPTGIGTWSAQGDFRWQSSVFFGPNNDVAERQGAYAIVNARLGWRSPDRRLSLNAFAENLFNKKYFVHMADIRGLNQSIVATWGRPRVYGLRAGFSF